MKISATKDKILLTGAAGFVGGYVLRELHKIGVPAEHITAISLTDDPIPGAGRVLVGNIVDETFVRDAIATERPSAIIHLAAIAEPAKANQDRENGWRINVEGTRLLAFATLAHAPKARFVFAGSAEAYGDTFNRATGAVGERSALRPQAYYGATKAVSDIMLGQLRSDGFDAIRFRAFNHSGPGQLPTYVIPAFASQIAKIEAGGQPAVIKVGNLESKRDFCDVRDVARAYASSVISDISPSCDAVYNLCSGQAVTVQSLLDHLLTLTEMSIAVERDPARMRPSEVPVAFGDPAAAKAELGWGTQLSLEETLRDTLDYYRSLEASSQD